LKAHRPALVQTPEVGASPGLLLLQTHLHSHGIVMRNEEFGYPVVIVDRL